MFTASQIVAHLIGDYLLQSDWMAQEKTKRLWPAMIHGFVYTLPFIFLVWHMEIFWAVLALVFLAWTHAVIDHYRLARYLCWAKNCLSPPFYNLPWEDCKTTGYPKSKPAWMSVWLLIIADNTMHLIVNAGILVGFEWMSTR